VTKFSPTQEHIRLAEALMLAMANEGTIRPVVEAYENEILAKHRFKIAPHWGEASGGRIDINEVILDRNAAFQLSDEDSKVYFAECYAARDAAGLKVSQPDFCPLCVAENLRIRAETALLESMGSIPGLESFSKKTYTMTLEDRKKAVDLTLKLMAPFCEQSADKILQRIMGSEHSKVAISSPGM